LRRFGIVPEIGRGGARFELSYASQLVDDVKDAPGYQRCGRLERQSGSSSQSRPVPESFKSTADDTIWRPRRPDGSRAPLSAALSRTERELRPG
jgi:hypothetical protein